MTNAAYNNLSQEDQRKHDEYMNVYFGSEYYHKLTDKYTPQVNKMDKFHLAYAICNGSNLFGLDHFAWKKLKEIGADNTQLEFIVSYGKAYNQDIYEEAYNMLNN